MATVLGKKRFRWLDIAKGMAILCTIIGHTVSNGHLRNFIFSFHMPLFFVAAGYTIRPIPSEELAKATWKDFKRLYIPVFVMREISFLVEISFKKEEVLYSLWDNMRRILWGNGNDYTMPGGFPVYGVGVLWFLIALFWCKLAYRICLNKVKNYRPIFLLFLTVACMWEGQEVRLPQCLDLIPVGMLFMEEGYQLRQSGKEDAPAMHLVGIGSFFVWIYLLWTQDVYIELAVRKYPQFILSVFVAGIACLAVFQFSKALENFSSSRVLEWVGRNSLDLLCIHYLDRYFTFWKIAVFSSQGEWAVCNQLLSSLCRVALDVGILFVWLWLKKAALGQFKHRI